MYSQQGDHAAWERFRRTGKVEDYLSYCQLKQQPGVDNSREAVPFDAAHNGRDRPAELQIR